jgi:hypothetical protein
VLDRLTADRPTAPAHDHFTSSATADSR